MEHDDLDRWLSNDDEIVPSSGFAAGVMDAVRHEASKPQAIPFPWKWALPGMVATALAVVSTVVSGFRAFNALSPGAMSEGPIGSLLTVILHVGTSSEVAWVFVVAVMTVVPVMLALQLTRGHS